MLWVNSGGAVEPHPEISHLCSCTDVVVLAVLTMCQRAKRQPDDGALFLGLSVSRSSLDGCFWPHANLLLSARFTHVLLTFYSRFCGVGVREACPKRAASSE